MLLDKEAILNKEREINIKEHKNKKKESIEFKLFIEDSDYWLNFEKIRRIYLYEKSNIKNEENYDIEKFKEYEKMFKQEVEKIIYRMRPIFAKVKMYCCKKLSPQAIAKIGIEDVNNSVMVGCYRAVMKYSVNGAASLETLSHMYGFGEVVDEIRRMSIQPISIYNNNNKVEELENKVQANKNEKLNEEELENEIKSMELKKRITISNIPLNIDYSEITLIREMYQTKRSETRKLPLKRIIKDKKSREVIYYKYYLNFNDSDILSSVLGISRATVYRLEKKGLKCIKDFFGKQKNMRNTIYD